MRECKKCGRPLKADEENLCPACQSETDWVWKTVWKGAVAVVAIAIAILSRLGKGKGA